MPLLYRKEHINREKWWNKINEWKEKYPFEYKETNDIKIQDIIKN